MKEPSTAAPPLGGAWKKALGGLAFATLLVLNVGALSPTPTDTWSTPTTSEAAQAAEVTCVVLEVFEEPVTFEAALPGITGYGKGPLTVDLRVGPAGSASDQAALTYFDPIVPRAEDLVELEPAGDRFVGRLEHAREGADLIVEPIDERPLFIDRLDHPRLLGDLWMGFGHAPEPKVVPCHELLEPRPAEPSQMAAPLPGEVACHLGLPHGGDHDLFVTATMVPLPSVGEATDA